jgi:multidrug efflux pump subunit AcrA (membrane-fusion protein)
MKPKTIEERITAIEAQRADLAAQLKQATTKAEQAASTGGNILAAQTTVRDLEGAISALDQALDDAQAELAAEQAAAQRAQVVEQLRGLVEQRQVALQQMGEHAQAIHAALEVHLTGLRAAHAEYRQRYYDAMYLLREMGGTFRHFMQMTEDRETTDAALLDDLAAQGLDLNMLLAMPDGITNGHHWATRPATLGPLLPEDAPFRAEVTRLVFAQHAPPAPPPHQTTDARRSPLAPASQPGAAPDDGRAAFIQQVKERVRQAESGDTAA